MIVKICKFTLILFSCALPAIAAEPYGPTEQEAKLLPSYCQGDPYWKSALGPEITWNNHTCYGINRLNRYYKSGTAWERKAQLETALGDFNYSIGHLKPDFKLMPEIYVYRGTTYKLLARNGEAMTDFLKAISLDPKLAKAYSELADIYESKLSRRDKALEIVTEGLRHNPQAKTLQRRYTEFGGKLPYPEAVAKTMSTDETKAEVKPKEKLEAATPSTDITDQASDRSKQTAPPEPTPQSDQPKIGSPTNPYCRFCPD
jgi:tetratricopeptide (TPR) repeat protein